MSARGAQPRVLHGLLAVDKPRGWTSRSVVTAIRNVLLASDGHPQQPGPDVNPQRRSEFRRDAPFDAGGAEKPEGRGVRRGPVRGQPRRRWPVLKVGHGGTLDPFATGVCVIGIGWGTKRLGDYQGNALAPELRGASAYETAREAATLVDRLAEAQMQAQANGADVDTRELASQVDAKRHEAYLLRLAKKTYVCRIRLGARTDSLDSDGAVTAELPYEHVTRDAVVEALSGEISDAPRLSDSERPLALGVGELMQLPPAVSALRVDGQRLHKLVREGGIVEEGVDAADDANAPRRVSSVLSPRPVRVYNLKLLKLHLPFLDVEVECGHGFYVRRLADDLGIALGTYGHAVELRRTRQGPFSLDDALPVESWTYEEIAAARKAVRT
jgi:tRNA pseudouridine(55) synthase